MPSPQLTLQSSSEPDFCARSGSIPPSHRSYCSAPARKSSWSRMSKKLFSLAGSRKEHSSNSDLTEENLQEHNRRQALNDLRNSKCSPYYKGLLAIDTYKLVDMGLSSPGRESHATTMQTSSTSQSSFVVKMKEWSHLFNKARRVPASSNRSSANLAELTLPEEMGIDKKTLTKSSSGVLKANQKPLRERVSEADQKPIGGQNQRQSINPRTLGQLKRATSATAQSQSASRVSTRIDDRDSSDQSLTGMEFIWASKYRPKALEDFICNKEIAMSLQRQVRYNLFLVIFFFKMKWCYFSGLKFVQ